MRWSKPVARREFTVAGEYVYDRRSPVRWIISHILRYPLLPLIALVGTICTTGLFNYGTILIGRAFDLVVTAGTSAEQLLWLALTLLAARVSVGLIEAMPTSGMIVKKIDSRISAAPGLIIRLSCCTSLVARAITSPTC